MGRKRMTPRMPKPSSPLRVIELLGLIALFCLLLSLVFLIIGAMTGNVPNFGMIFFGGMALALVFWILGWAIYISATDP
jgi:hypothetical protein